MRRWAAFCGIRIVDYVLMSNHFHILCEVPEPKPLTQGELLERIKEGYGSKRVEELQEQLAGFAQQPGGVEQSKRLETHFQRPKEKFGYKRKRDPTALDILDPPGLWAFRKLRVRTFGS